MGTTLTADGVAITGGMTLYGYARCEGGGVCEEWVTSEAVFDGLGDAPRLAIAPARRPHQRAVLAACGIRPLYASRERYDAAQAEYRAAAQAARDRRDRMAAERAARRTRYEALCDRLYDEAVSLADDDDDRDVLEHDCQGHADRLREFIAARRPGATTGGVR